MNDTNEPLFPLKNFSLPKGQIKMCLMGSRVKGGGGFCMICKMVNTQREQSRSDGGVIEYDSISTLPYCTQNYQFENMEKHNPGVRKKNQKFFIIPNPTGNFQVIPIW